MRKNFIVKFMTAILLFAMSFTLVFVGDRAIEVEAAGDEITVDYTFVDADVSSAANQKGKVASFKFEGDFEVQLKNDTYDKPLRYFKTDASGRYVVIREKNVFTIKNNGENTIVSFKFIRTNTDAFKCSLTNANACSDSTVDKDLVFTPINPNEDIVISLIAEAYGVTGMVITYSEPTVATVSDGSHETLLAAIAKENIEEIVITKPIEFKGSNSKEYDVDAKNKILRAEITGLDAFGALQEGSTNVLFHIKAGDTVTIKNAVIYGGSRAAIINKGYLYMENVTVSRSGNYTNGTSPDSRFTDAYGGICNYNDSSTSLTAKLVMKNCNITRNVSKNGGGILNNKGTVIIDGCSITENRASNNGGAIQTRESSGNVIINNTLIANNAANNYGGGIYLNASKVYIINSTITGNATANTTMGGGITNWYAYLYAVNNIITDNYAFEDGTPLENDFFTTGTNSYEILLYNNIYGASNIQGITATLGNNHQLENKSSNVELFVGYQTSGNILGDGSTSTVAFEKPAIIKLSDGRYYAPVNINCEIVENGIKTYMAYTAEGKGSSFYLSYMKDCVNTKLGQAFDISENEVTTFISGEERTNSIIGSSNASNVKIRTVRGTNSNTDAGTISGITLYGESYEYGSLVTVTAIPNEGYELDYWMDENGTILSSQKEYTFEVLKNITITPVWVSTVNVGTVTISNLTCDPVVYGGSRSIKLNNLILEVGSKIEGLYFNDTKVADENLFLLPNISGITDENGRWIATEDVELTANIVPTLGVISTTGYSGTYDGSAHEITVEAISPEDIVYSWYFNGSLIEGANSPTLNVTNVLESGKYYCLLTSIIDGEEVSVRTETIIVDIAAIKVAIPTINNDTYTYNGSEQSVELNGIESFMTVTGDKATNAGNYEVIISLDSNYEWQESFNGKYAWTIEKADCDLSHIKFEDLTVIYNGNKQVIEITGTLPKGVEASYTNNEGIDVNTYDATVEFVSANYNVEGIKLTATLTITKATYDMSGVKFENVTVTYDGAEHEVVINGTLPEGVTVAYTTNKGTNAGTYNALAKFTYDTANYNVIADMNAVLTINKAKVALPEATTSFVYDGTAHTAVASHDLYTIEGATATVVGSYEATVTLNDTANYEWAQEFNGKVAWTITKATYDMSGITFADVTVTYDGTEYVIEITGTLPEGVTVAYTTNKGTVVGTYNAVATFTYDTANYNAIADMNAVLTINKAIYDMSNVKFENVTVTYDGAEHEVEITGTLPEGVTVSYTTNKGTVVGTYNAVATFTYDTANYNAIADMNAVLTITKATYDMSGITFADVTVTYDGTEYVIEITGTLPEGVTVAYTTNKGTVVGTYNAVATFTYDTANYNAIADMNAVLTINKAIYDMSNVKFENVTVTYDGAEHEVEITGTLPEGVTVSYTTNKGTVVGTYNAVATFTYDTANYNIIADMNAVLTINKAKVALPEATTSFVYDGTAKVAVAAHDLYTVTEGSATNAGSYEAVVTLKDTVNYEWAETFNGKVAWTITKPSYDMSGITFADVTVTYDGAEHKVVINGTLPAGVTVTYENNVGTNVGVYNAIAKFTGDANYNAIPDMNAVLTIKTASMSFDTNKDDDKPEDVIVTAPEGIDPNKELYVEMVEMEESDKDFSSYAPKGHRVGIAYDVKLLKDGVSVQPDGTLVIKMLIPEDLKGKNFSIMHVHNDGEEVTILKHEIDGDYVVVETNKLSEFVFVYEMGSLLWIAIVLAVIAMLEGAFLVFMITQKNKFRTKKLAVVYPPFVFGMFVPEWHIVLIIVFAIIVAALAAVDIVYALSFFGFRSKANSETEEEQMIVIEEEVEEPVAEEVTEEPQQAVEEVVETEPVVEESIEDDDDEDVMQVWDEETHSFTIIRIIKSFTARLIQSKDEVKAYYDIIKNELLSYKKVKSRISFKHEAFKFGKDNVARLRFRGKTLCLYLALNPADYENTKYKIEDMSAISNSSDVPTMYRINLPRRADYAKELIYDLMKKLGAERMDINYKEYSKEYPYEDNEALLEKGLIKKSVKVIGNGTSTKTLVNPVNIVKKVSASEVNNLITDEQVIELIEQSTRIADKTKKTIINIDTLSQYFNENETVTLEEIKKRVPNVEKKATYYKVLARGTLDKPLTVDADDFSIEAEKMIIVTGGKVLVSKAK